MTFILCLHSEKSPWPSKFLISIMEKPIVINYEALIPIVEFQTLSLHGKRLNNNVLGIKKMNWPHRSTIREEEEEKDTREFILVQSLTRPNSAVASLVDNPSISNLSYTIHLSFNHSHSQWFFSQCSWLYNLVQESLLSIFSLVFPWL